MKLLSNIFNVVIDFLSNNFELLMAINIGLTISFLLLVVLLKMSEFTDKDLTKILFKNFLLLVVIFGELFFLTFAAWIYWVNYQQVDVQPNTFSYRFQEDKDWIKGDQKIYYVEENQLFSIKINGEGRRVIFQGEDDVKEYVFSPDGKYILVLTDQSLHLVDRRTTQHRLVDTLGLKEDLKGAISSIEWSKDSKKFVYEVARWSKFSSQNNFYLYVVESKKKYPIKSLLRRLSSLYWSNDSQNLYYLQYEAKDTEYTASSFSVNVYKISLDLLEPKLVASFPSESSSLPIESLALRNINLHLENKKYVFGKPSGDMQLKSSKGAVLGVDQDDYLYYVKNDWFKKRLFRLERRVLSDQIDPRYSRGDFVVSEIKWLPNSAYVVLKHHDHGIVVMDPKNNKVSLVIQTEGRAIGWHN